MKWGHLSRSSYPSIAGVREASTGLAIGLTILGITTSELLLYSGHADYALWGHLVTLFACTLLPLRFDSEIQVFRAIALVPLFRLVNLGMPVFFEFTINWFPFVYGPLIPVLLLIAREQPSVSRDPWPDRLAYVLVLLPLAVPLSLLLAEAEYAILEPEPLVPSLSVPHLLFITVVMVGFVGFVEELLFRRILQRTLEHRIGWWSGIAISSGLFGLMHSGYGVPAEIAFAGVLGFLFGLVYDYTDSLLLVSVIHGLLNVFLFAVIPIRGSVLPV